MRTASQLEILRRMEEVMGEARALPDGPPRLSQRSEVRDGGVIRRSIRFDGGDEDTIPAWLLLPAESAARRMPAAICLHQTTKIGKDEPAGLGGKANLHYARELALRGFVTLAPDYPNFGEYVVDAYARGYASTTRKAVRNHMLAVSLLASLPFVDPKRIAACGHSLGGHNSLFLAAFDERVCAVVTSCGFTSFARYMGGDLTGWSHQGYMPRIAERYEKSPAKMPFEFRDVLAAIAPRPVFVNAPRADANFDPRGVDEAVRESRHGAVVVEHPDCGHDFPPEVRLRAWDWLTKNNRLR